jgi:hypothetical protein
MRPMFTLPLALAVVAGAGCSDRSTVKPAS